MTKSELIDRISQQQTQLPRTDVQMAVHSLVRQMTETLANDGRVEIRGFGSFTLHHRDARIGRNPKTGEPVSLPAKKVPHFKPGKDLKVMVDSSMHTTNK